MKCLECKNETVNNLLCAQCEYVEKQLKAKRRSVIMEFPVQIGESLTCDFHENTWTFEMPKGFAWTGGKFAIVPTEQLEALRSQSGKCSCCPCPDCSGKSLIG